LASAIQAEQWGGMDTNRAPLVNYWMWRFDRIEDPVPLDNFWGKSEEQAVEDLVRANNPITGQPGGPADVEWLVDPYFPNTIPSLPENLKGWAAHLGGRNRLMLDGHIQHVRDRRTR
jgi:prepilin-type processing-associated H-X9-DG protein